DGDAVGPEFQEGLATVPRLAREVPAVRDEDLLGEGERPAERFACTRETPLHRRVQRTDLGDGHQRLLLHTILTPTHAGCEPAFASFQPAHPRATGDARPE